MFNGTGLDTRHVIRISVKGGQIFHAKYDHYFCTPKDVFAPPPPGICLIHLLKVKLISREAEKDKPSLSFPPLPGPRGGVRATSFPRPSHILHNFSSEPPQNARPSIFFFKCSLACRLKTFSQIWPR